MYTVSFIVTGDVNGHIKFYDGDLKLINMYNKFSLDTIRSISFSKEKPSISDLGYPKDCTLDAKPFVIRWGTQKVFRFIMINVPYKIML